tara:strand:+ start:1757 stop:2419 length:663 start_codon:yes stop_codon:yes gene_type:complete
VKTIKYSTLILILIISSCSKDDDDSILGSITGSNNTVTISRELPAFNKIHIEGDLIINIQQDSTQEVAINVNYNLQDIIITNVDNNTLFVSLRNGSYKNTTFELNIQMPFLQEFQMNDDTQGKIDFVLDQLDIKINNSAQLELIGSSESLNINLGDDSRIDGFLFATKSLGANLQDDSELSITCNSELNGSVSDESILRYKGSPVINATTSVSGEIINAN